jgi:subfamily B ATP-binding cassette protein HlyB/CyaB
LERTSFRYSPDRPEVLKSLSLEVAAGEVIGIVGGSGSGKSTLSKLIERQGAYAALHKHQAA